LFQPDPPAAIHVLHQAAPHVPLILFADPADRDFATQCLEVGATDFMLEGYMDTRTMDRTLRVAFRGLPSDPLAQACHDPLTGLMNRAGLIVEAQLWRESHPLCARRLLVSIRLQNFEAMLLYAGETAAELFLREVARLLRKRIRNTDLAAHVAPGHFAMLVQDVAEFSLPAVHRRIAKCLAELDQALTLGMQPLFSIHSEFLPEGSFPAFAELLRVEAGTESCTVPESASAPE
jgi:GGDEF domain-containing protein